MEFELVHLSPILSGNEPMYFSIPVPFSLNSVWMPAMFTVFGTFSCEKILKDLIYRIRETERMQIFLPFFFLLCCWNFWKFIKNEKITESQGQWILNSNWNSEARNPTLIDPIFCETFVKVRFTFVERLHICERFMTKDLGKFRTQN